MQATAEQLREQLWTKLQVIYDKYTEKAGGQILTSKVEQIVHDALGQQTQQQIDYVVKNMFRLDVDQNGSVTFLQFANFLFQRHCGQMSLQRMHLMNKMSHGSERKMTQAEFHTLMNNAYKFLGVECQQQVTNSIFVQADKDKDSLITYVEYFQIINKYICKKTLTESKPEPVPQGKQRISRLRTHMWKNLRALYEAYVSGRNLSATDKELRGLLAAIVGDMSQTEITFILTELFKLDFKTLEFNSFAVHFFYLIGQLGLSRYSKNQVSSKKTLTKQEFVVVFKNTFKFLNVSKIKDQFLWLHFAKIDKNHDGLISYDQYLDWIRRFIAVLNYFGDEFYVPEDDMEIEGYDMFPVEIKPTQFKPATTLNNFVFSDLSLAYQVRQRCYFLLEKYDVNKDKLFDQTQIQAALVELLKQNQYELAYVTRNVFRYDKDGDKNVTYDQLTNFCVQQHFGQMAIQRLHRKNSYSRGKQRIMNQEQFAATLKYALSFIEIVPSDQILKLLFKEIDLDHDGWISYEVYFLFLRYYFGSLSEAAQHKQKKEEVKLTKDEQFLLSLKELSALDRFVRILLDQLRIICAQFDYNKNFVYEVDEIEAILGHVFKLDANEISYVLYSYFRFSSRKDQFVTYEEMIAIILEIYFIQILFKRRYRDQNSQVWKTKLISLDEFIVLVTEACFFIRVKPPKQDLKEIFIILDTNKDGFISFQQYINFIRQYLGRGLNIVDESPKKQKTESKIPGVSEQQLAFIEALWGQLKKYFDQYDKGSKGFINEQQLKAFSIQVLRETTKRELDYIFWNLFRVDSNSNREVDFEEFAPFILSHAGQISLQRYHKEQVKGKSTLNEEELFIVLGNAYNFLSTMPKSKGIVSIIYKRIAQNGACSYGNLLGWINNALCKKFR